MASPYNKTTYENLASAQERFGKAVLRFASFNKPVHSDMIYRENVYRMSNFMAANAGERQQDRSMQERYRKARHRLGEAMDATCDFALMTKCWNPDAGTELAPWPKY